MRDRATLINMLKDVIEDEEANDIDRAASLRELLRWDKRWAEEHLAMFVDLKKVWAIKIALVIADSKRNKVGGLGLDESD